MVGIYKTIVSLILWPLWSVYFLFVMPLFYLYMIFLPQKYYHYFTRPMCWLFCLFGGQCLKLKGQLPPTNNGPYIYMINHGSLFDIFSIGFYIKHYMTAIGAIEEFRWPIWGTVCNKYGIVPIERSNIINAVHSLNNVDKAIRERISFLIAPEGTRTITGPFHLSKNTAVSIVPIGIIGAFEAKKKNDWRLKPGIITTCFGEVITYNEYNHMSVEELRDYVRMKVKDLIKEQ